MSRRYRQEWLGIIVTGGIVELKASGNSQNDRYLLPQSHGDLLCRRAGNNNLGVNTQEIPILTASALSAVQKDFSKGRGIPFSVYRQFQSFMAELSAAKHEQVLIRDFLPSVDDGKLKKNVRRENDKGRGLGMMWGRQQALNLLEKAGFSHVAARKIPNDPFNLHFQCRI